MDILISLGIIVVVLLLVNYLISILPGDAELKGILKIIIVIVALLYLIAAVVGWVPLHHWR